MKAILTFIKIIVSIFFIILVSINAITFIDKKVNKEKFPTILGYNYLKVISGSMKPTIDVNDIVVVKKMEDDKYKIKDVIVYEENGNYITHRIIDIDNGVITTKGDANNVSEKINYNQVVAKVIFYNHTFSKVFNIITKPIFLVVIAVVGLIIPELLTSRKIK